MSEGQLLSGLLWFVAFLFSTTVHEAMHALVAYRGGDPTAYHGGQVSLSPMPHIRREPIGMLVVPLITALSQGWAIGWASTPYNPRWAAMYPKRAAMMGAAGPIGNLIIALAAFLLLKVGLVVGLFTPPDVINFEQLVAASPGAASMLATALSILLVLNVLLAAFNLVPLPPLDGASVMGLFLTPERARRMQQLSRTPVFQLAGLLIAWRVFPFIVGPLFSILVKLVHPQLSYS